MNRKKSRNYSKNKTSLSDKHWLRGCNSETENKQMTKGSVKLLKIKKLQARRH